MTSNKPKNFQVRVYPTEKEKNVDEAVRQLTQ